MSRSMAGALFAVDGRLMRRPPHRRFLAPVLGDASSRSRSRSQRRCE